MIKNSWLLLVAFAFAAGCATQEPPKPAPPPAHHRPRARGQARASAACAEGRSGSRKSHFCRHHSFRLRQGGAQADGKATLDELREQDFAVSTSRWSSPSPCRHDRLRPYTRRCRCTAPKRSRPTWCRRASSRTHLHRGKGKKQPVTGDKCKKMGPAHAATRSWSSAWRLIAASRSRSSARAAVGPLRAQEAPLRRAFYCENPSMNAGPCRASPNSTRSRTLVGSAGRIQAVARDQPAAPRVDRCSPRPERQERARTSAAAAASCPKRWRSAARGSRASIFPTRR